MLCAAENALRVTDSRDRQQRENDRGHGQERELYGQAGGQRWDVGGGLSSAFLDERPKGTAVRCGTSVTSGCSEKVEERGAEGIPSRRRRNRQKVTAAAGFGPALPCLRPGLINDAGQANGTKSGFAILDGGGRKERRCSQGPEAKGKMRSLLVAFTTLMLFAGGAAETKVAITVDKNAQLMTVAVDGVERYRWPVSTGLPSHETPNGSFRTFRMEEDHYSKEFDDAPMPHSIFFTKIGHAIHGTNSVNRLGSPASHGCVRLSRANASKLYALVQERGRLNTTVTLTGSSQIALARNPRPRTNTAVARRAPAQQQ